MANSPRGRDANKATKNYLSPTPPSRDSLGPSGQLRGTEAILMVPPRFLLLFISFQYKFTFGLLYILRVGPLCILDV